MAPAETISALYEPSLAASSCQSLASLSSRPALRAAAWGLQARVYVPDDRFNWLCDLYKPKSTVAAYLDIVDIAGLVKCVPAYTPACALRRWLGHDLEKQPCMRASSPAASVTGCFQLCQPCRGAAEGEGLGNNFLSHIAAVDGILHVCRAFEDADVTHVEDRIDPVADLDIIHGCTLSWQLGVRGW